MLMPLLTGNVNDLLGQNYLFFFNFFVGISREKRRKGNSNGKIKNIVTGCGGNDELAQVEQILKLLSRKERANLTRLEV